MPIPSEFSDQVEYFKLVEMYRTKYPELNMISANMNGMYSNPVHVAKLKLAGLTVGYPDIIIDVALWGYHGARIELKRRDGGKGLSSYQKECFARLEKQGYFCRECHGWVEAWNITCWYLGIKEGMV